MIEISLQVNYLIYTWVGPVVKITGQTQTDQGTGYQMTGLIMVLSIRMLEVVIKFLIFPY